MKVKTIYSQPRIQIIKMDAATALAASGIHGYGPGDPIWDDDEKKSEDPVEEDPEDPTDPTATTQDPVWDAKPYNPWTTWD